MAHSSVLLAKVFYMLDHKVIVISILNFPIVSGL
jgi:hypothetical protein